MTEPTKESSTKILVKIDGVWKEWDVESVLILKGGVTYPKSTGRTMHPSQQAILDFAESNDIKDMTLN